MPVVQFSIPAAPWERLEKAVIQGESTNQAAKRLLTQLLMGEDSPAPDPNRLEGLEGQVEYLAHQVEVLNTEVKDLTNVTFQSGDPISDRLDKIESDLKSLALQFSDRLYAVIQAQEKLAIDSKPAEELAPPPAVAVPSPARLPRATRRQPKGEGETP